MEKVIQEGSLRLHIAESCCDVVLSCQGHRLMAHKLILSIASPVLRELLKEDSSEASVIILPDISASTMSLILDYIYTGSAQLYISMIQDFLSAAYLLKIHLNLSEKDIYKNCKTKLLELSLLSQEECDTKEINNKPEIKKDSCLKTNEVYSIRKQKKIPDLLPLKPSNVKRKNKRKLCDLIIPSPWCPRIDRPFLGDPRNQYLGATDIQIHSPNRHKQEENDSNNNLPFTSLHSLPRYIPNKLNDAINNIYLNASEKQTHEVDLSQKYTRSTPIKDSSDLLGSHTRVSEQEKLIRDRFDKKFGTYLKQKPRDITSLPTPLQLKITTTVPPDVIYSSESETQLSSTEQPTEESDSNNVVRDNLNNNNNNLSNDFCEDKINVVSASVDEQSVCKNKPFRCEHCGKCFSQLRNYKYHRSLHEGTKEFSAKCQECGKVFNDKGYLSSHMKIHRDKKEYACPHCPKRFNQRVAYNMHFRIHTGVKPHECPTCGKTFSRKMLLKQHQRVHTGERPYSCPECGKTFADRSNMSLHARLHTGIKPYACNLCPKSFTKKHHLKTHMNFHTGLKPYKCEKCGLSFSQSSNMRTHYKKCILKQNSSGIKNS